MTNKKEEPAKRPRPTPLIGVDFVKPSERMKFTLSSHQQARTSKLI